MEFVVNEWLLDFLLPDADPQNKSMAIQFLEAAVKKGDKIVVRRPSPFFKKFYRYMKQFGSDVGCKKRLTYLNNLFHDSERTIIIDDADTNNLPADIENLVPADDKYLVELALSCNDKIIITTDTRLKEKL